MARKKKSSTKTRVISQAAPKAGTTSVVVVEPSTPAAPKKRGGGGGRRRKAPAKRRASPRRKGGGGRFGRFSGAAASGQKHALAAWQTSQPQLMTVAGAAAAGLLQRQGIKVPKLINSLSTPVNVGLVAWVAARFMKSPLLDHLATGMLSVGAYGMGAGITIAGPGDIEGDYSTVGYTTAGTAIAYDDVQGDDLEGEFED